MLRRNATQRIANGGRRLRHMVLIAVLGARPEEPSQTVLPAPRNDMDMQMGHALTDLVVHGNKRSLCFHSAFNRDGEQLRVGEELLNSVGGKIPQRLDVLLGDQQGVAGKQRAVIAKRQRSALLEHDVRLRTVEGNGTELTHAPAY